MTIVFVAEGLPITIVWPEFFGAIREATRQRADALEINLSILTDALVAALVRSRLRVSFPERWGNTEDEALERLTATVERWIASMQRTPG